MILKMSHFVFDKDAARNVRLRRKFCSFNSIDFVNGWRKFFSFRDCVVKFNFFNSNFCIFRNFQRYINSTFSPKRIISLWVYQILFFGKLTPFLFSNFCMVSRFLSEHSWISSILFKDQPCCVCYGCVVSFEFLPTASCFQPLFSWLWFIVCPLHSSSTNKLDAL